VYPSAGEDRWLAIAVFDDAEWGRLVRAIGSPEWAADPRFATQAERHAHQDELDEHLSRWTRERTNHEAMELLQAAGVNAGAVQNAQDLDERDPQIAHRGTFFDMDHPVIGKARFEGSPVLFSGLEQDNWRSAPRLGEDNRYVFTKIVGLPDDEVSELIEEGVL
jgi:crotonobetainyl-CoA:carnitine CoA-transferase CaiB-like acyl-CoA transferase